MNVLDGYCAVSSAVVGALCMDSRVIPIAALESRYSCFPLFTNQITNERQILEPHLMAHSLTLHHGSLHAVYRTAISLCTGVVS